MNVVEEKVVKYILHKYYPLFKIIIINLYV